MDTNSGNEDKNVGTAVVDLETRQRGMVIISALINFADWLAEKKVFHFTLDEKDRAELVKNFLGDHSEDENYFMQAEQIAERLGVPFQEQEPPVSLNPSA